jgi:hypothetical protein
MSTTYLPNASEFIEIGRIPRLRPIIDKTVDDNGHTLSEQLKKRMSVVDLIPCKFEVFESNMLQQDGNVSDKFRPSIIYQIPIENFKIQCKVYGLIPYQFLRLYLNSMSSVDDNITNTYTKNIIDDTLNSMLSGRIGNLFKQYNRAENSLGRDEIDTVTWEHVSSIDAISNNLQALATAVTHGARISFPKIWNDVSYSPQLVCNIRLVSPYGHPDAISKFIIEPLGYLMILLSPKTKHGIINKRPNYIALKSYGMTNMSICSPSTINIRRGGDDGSYNIYKQPLTLDIALTFDTVTEGFATFNNFDVNPTSNEWESPEKDWLTKEITTKRFDDEFEIKPTALFPTLKNLVNSLRPFDYDPAKTFQGEGTEKVSRSASGFSLAIAESREGVVEETLASIPLDNYIDYEYSSILESPMMTWEDGSTSGTGGTSGTSGYYTQSILFTANNMYLPFEISVGKDENYLETIYDPQNFQNDDTFKQLISTRTEVDNNSFVGTHELFFKDDFNEENKSFILSSRLLREDNLPGLWSNLLIHQSLYTDNFTVLFYPDSRIKQEYLRWIVVDEYDNEYGPYILSATLDVGTYTLKIVNIQSLTIIKEEDIFVTGDNQIHKINLDLEYGSILVTLDIPEGFNKSDFSYILIPEYVQTFFEGNIDEVFDSLEINRYYLNLKYKGQDLFYNVGINKEIDITSNTLKTYKLTVDENLKIANLQLV